MSRLVITAVTLLCTSIVLSSGLHAQCMNFGLDTVAIPHAADIAGGSGWSPGVPSNAPKYDAPCDPEIPWHGLKHDAIDPDILWRGNDEVTVEPEKVIDLRPTLEIDPIDTNSNYFKTDGGNLWINPRTGQIGGELSVGNDTTFSGLGSISSNPIIVGSMPVGNATDELHPGYLKRDGNRYYIQHFWPDTKGMEKRVSPNVWLIGEGTATQEPVTGTVTVTGSLK